VAILDAAVWVLGRANCKLDHFSAACSLDSNMKIGFTGTREGMTWNQKQELTALLSQINNETPMGVTNGFHHGDCKGADVEAAHIAFQLGLSIWIYPPLSDKQRGWYREGVTVQQPKPYLDRDKDIVNACELLIAAPKGPEILRSGTWATVRYARKCGKPILILDV
jgi:hypothetical protein